MRYQNITYNPAPLRNIKGGVVKLPTDGFFVLCQDNEADTYRIVQNSYLNGDHRNYLTGVLFPKDKNHFDLLKSMERRVCIGSFSTVIEAKIYMRNLRKRFCVNNKKGMIDMISETLLYKLDVINNLKSLVVNVDNEIESIDGWLLKQAEKHPEYFI